MRKFIQLPLLVILLTAISCSKTGSGEDYKLENKYKKHVGEWTTKLKTSSISGNERIDDIKGQLITLMQRKPLWITKNQLP